MVETYQELIGGEFVDGASGKTLDVLNPARDEIIATVPASDAEDVDRAAKAAAKAFETWRETTPQERSLILLKVADALEARAEEVGTLESRNTGKPVAAAIDEMAVCASGAQRVAKALEYGTVWISDHFTLTSETPHGGVKESGWGKDGSGYALEDYTFVKNVMINSEV